MTRIYRFKHEKAGSWPNRIRKIILHHSVGRVPPDGRSAIEELHKINAYHQAKNWGGHRAPSIVYHYGIEIVTGKIWKLNDEMSRTWHASNANDYSLGVVVLGNLETYKPSIEEEIKLKKAMDRLQRRFFLKYGIQKKDWISHDEVKSTRCCGKYLKMILEYWRDLSR